jgi:hypothetical protein
MLPPKIEKLYSNIFIRIFRFIGGICLILTITEYFKLFPGFLHVIILIFAIIQSVQIFFIFLIKFSYGIYIIIYKSKEFEIRNSPLNYFATHFTKILICVKTGCQVVGVAGTVIATGAAFDAVLEA